MSTFSAVDASLAANEQPRVRAAAMAGTLAGKVAIVTGAARGIGASEARMLLARGAKVILGLSLDDLGRDFAASYRKIPTRRGIFRLDATSALGWTDAVATSVISVAPGSTSLITKASSMDGWNRRHGRGAAGPRVSRYLATLALGLGVPALHRRRPAGDAVVNTSSGLGIVATKNASSARKGESSSFERPPSTTPARRSRSGFHRPSSAEASAPAARRLQGHSACPAARRATNPSVASAVLLIRNLFQRTRLVSEILYPV